MSLMFCRNLGFVSQQKRIWRTMEMILILNIKEISISGVFLCLRSKKLFRIVVLFCEVKYGHDWEVRQDTTFLKLGYWGRDEDTSLTQVRSGDEDTSPTQIRSRHEDMSLLQVRREARTRTPKLLIIEQSKVCLQEYHFRCCWMHLPTCVLNCYDASLQRKWFFSPITIYQDLGVRCGSLPRTHKFSYKTKMGLSQWPLGTKLLRSQIQQSLCSVQLR